MQKQRGVISKITLLVFFLVAAAAVLGVITYRMASNDSDIDPELQTTLDQAECEFASNDLCKFFASWTAAGDYSVQATRTQDGLSRTYAIESEEDGNFRLNASGDKTYEVVAVGQTVYIREEGGNWYQQNVEDPGKYREDSGAFNFSEPQSEEEADAYQAQGTETCGKRDCLRYSIDTGNQGVKNIWFDDQEYRLRRVTVERGNYSYDASVTYEDVTVDAPGESVVVGEGQQIAPGETKPRVLGSDTGGENDDNLPATGDVIDPEEYRLWLEQRQR